MPRKAGRDTELGEYLNSFKGVNNFSLKTLTNDIHNGKGDLDDNEALLMMLEHFDRADLSLLISYKEISNNP